MRALSNENTQNQNAMIFRFMRDYGGISQAQAVDEFGCYRLSARIWDLRKQGIKIKTEYRMRKNRSGNVVRYAYYVLERGK